MGVPLNTLEAFAAIPVAAVCCDLTFGKNEARVIREQLMGRTAYQEMEPYAFALACQLIHCDWIVAPQEQQFLGLLAQQLQFTPAPAKQILEVCDLLNRDVVAEQA